MKRMILYVIGIIGKETHERRFIEHFWDLSLKSGRVGFAFEKEVMN